MVKDNLIQVNSAQFNFQYDDQIHFPYSIATLIAYIKSKEHLNQKFKFEKTFVFREKIDQYIQECKDTDILLCSCYVWNWEITTYLAREVKKLNPNCLIIFGGPQVPENIVGFFNTYPFVDILVHGEGEYILENIFTAYIKDKDFSKVNGITTKDFRTPPQPRIDDLDTLLSPYLTNLIWDLVEKVDGVNWICSWETNRGCPYQCTFCDWGSATFTKMRKFSEERLFKEIEWFGDNKIVFIDCCDANFGIYQERDLHIARKLKEIVLKTGHLQKMAVSWAKNSSEKIIPIAKELQEGGILGAVTLAVQSLDPETLKIIKRANIKFDKFADLTAEFRLYGIPTYSEVIRGLPGETIDTFKLGLEILANTKIGSVNIYHTMILPNAPMNEPSYREKYKIKVIKSPIMLQHSSIHKRGLQEYEYIVVSTYSYTLEALKEMFLYSWAFHTLQKFGILECISRFYNQVHGIEFMKFFETFFGFCNTQNSIFSIELKKVIELRDNGYAGKGWDHYDPKLGDIIWPIEEASWLRLTYNKQKLSETLNSFLDFFEKKHGFNTNKKMLKDLVEFQIFLLTTREDIDVIKSQHFDYDWKTFFINNQNEVKPSSKYFSYENKVLEQEPLQWGYKVIWYGRRQEKYKCHPENLQAGYNNTKIFKEKRLEKISLQQINN